MKHTCHSCGGRNPAHEQTEKLRSCGVVECLRLAGKACRRPGRQSDSYWRAGRFYKRRVFSLSAETPAGLASETQALQNPSTPALI